MTDTRFCLIRHGETPWNTERRIQGHTDIGLDPEGVHQAGLAGRWLAAGEHRPQFLYSSDLLRARLTAEALAIALGQTIRYIPALRERRYGCFEGLTYDEARERHPQDYAAFERREPDYAFPQGGESLRTFSARVVAVLQALHAAHRGEVVAIVTHGGVLDIVNRFVRGNPLNTPRDFHIPNTGLNWIVAGAAGWHIDTWAETRHLDHGALDELDMA
ncbi:MAG: histidine phosphatase family protein [Betaproteobacteria bacterium]|nr:histidine phosphatase family protein [Betaproteobacteria bacterium]